MTTGASTPPARGDVRGTITVSGHGEVELTPDALRLELSVEVSAIGAADALTAARTTMADLRRAVSELGIATGRPADVGVQPLAAPRQARRARTATRPPSPSRCCCATRARSTSVLTVAGEAAGDRLRVGGLGFTVLDPGPARDEARRLALAEAERVARIYAEAAGRRARSTW